MRSRGETVSGPTVERQEHAWPAPAAKAALERGDITWSEYLGWEFDHPEPDGGPPPF